jgi:CBS domain-containing protein
MSEGVKTIGARIRCGELMTKTVRTTSSSSSLRDVAAIMRDGDVGAVPIVDDERLVGIVTDRDIVIRAIAEGMAADSPVSLVMTTDLVTVRPDDYVFEAARLMGEKQVRRLPVVDIDGSLAGIIAMADVALSMDDEEQIAETLEEISSGASFWQKN